MIIGMFNGWYFFWLALCFGSTAGLYYGLRNRKPLTQKLWLFAFLAIGLALHFLKVYIPPYSVDEARMLRDSWFVNICGANILIALFYPEEPLAKSNQLGETLDIIRFYYHHWMVGAIPMLMVLLGMHKVSYKHILSAPTGLLILMLFIMLNQIFQSELGFVPLRDRSEFFSIGYKNTSYIWGPGNDDAIGNFLALFTPDFFKTVPVGEFAGQVKYWPWFWLIVPVYVLVTPLSFLVSLVFDRKSMVADLKKRFKKTAEVK